ncbi:MAG TPA: hypothetical protein DDW90_08470 [Cyanobacteria bacterium UBA9971]|nr:hypothetical protein [Cyanobacteria bacterium UBA9971]
MPEAISSVKVYKPAFSSNNIIKSAMIPESPQDKLEIANKNLNKEEKKSFLGRFGIDIAAFTTGIVGIGTALKMHKVNKYLNQIAFKDSLTGLFNRRYLDKYLQDAVIKAEKNGTELHFFMIDIDKFKNVNTALDHDGGDTVLKRSTAVISQVVDKYNTQDKELLFARYGGEEFTLIVKGTSKDEAMRIVEESRSVVNKDKELKAHAENLATYFSREIKKLEKLKDERPLLAEEAKKLKELKNSGYEIVEKNDGLTISAGMCSFKDHDKIIKIPHDALILADLSLGRAKNTRNSLCIAETEEVVKYAKFKLENAANGKAKLSAEEKSHLESLIK